MLWLVALAGLLAWGAFAFGAVYPWAYWPLAGAAAAVGVAGLLRRGRGAPHVPGRPLVASLALLVLAVGAQLVPLPAPLLSRLSPGTLPLLSRFDLGFLARASAAPDAALSHPLSVEPGATALSLALLVAFGLLFLGVARGLRARDLPAFVPALIGVAVVVSLVALLQRAGGSEKIYGFWEPQYGRLGLAHGGGPFINRNHFAGWMLMVLPVALGYFASLVERGMEGAAPGWRGRVLWFATPAANRAVLVAAAIPVMGLALVLSLSRSGITCFLVALAVTGWVVRNRFGNPAPARAAAAPAPGAAPAPAARARRMRRRSLSAYLAFVALLALGRAGLDPILARFSHAQDDFPERYEAWQATWAIVRDFPAAGIGLGSYADVMFFYQRDNPIVRFDYAHNDWVQLLAEGGLVVAVPAGLFLVLFATEVRRRFRHDRRPAAGSAGGLSSSARPAVLHGPVALHGDTPRRTPPPVRVSDHGARAGEPRLRAAPDRAASDPGAPGRDVSQNGTPDRPGLDRRAAHRELHTAPPDPTVYWVRAGAVTGLLAVALQELVEYTLQMPGNAALCVVLMGMAAGGLGHGTRMHRPAACPPEPGPGSPPAKAR